MSWCGLPTQNRDRKASQGRDDRNPDMDFHPQWLVVKKLSSVPMAFESDFHM